MKYNKEITLKDGRVCTLRNGTEEDGEAALENFILTHVQTDFLLPYPDEITMTAESEGQFMKAKEESPDEALILACIGDKVAGIAGISRIGSRFKVRHRAEFGISVDMDLWGLGIGRAMTEACIECAKSAGYKQLELDVVGDNWRAVALYEKCGFVEFGRNPRGFLFRTGDFKELVSMRLEL